MILKILKSQPRVPAPFAPGEIRIRLRFAWWPTTVQHDVSCLGKVERYVVWWEYYWERQKYTAVNHWPWFDWVTVSRES